MVRVTIVKIQYAITIAMLTTMTIAVTVITIIVLRLTTSFFLKLQLHDDILISNIAVIIFL